MNSLSNKMFKTQTSVGKVMYATSWDRKGEILLDFAEPRQTINSNHYIMVLTNLKAQTSRVRPQKKTNLLLQHDNARPHPSFKTVEHILTSIRSNVLQHFPSNNAVIAAVKQLVTGKQLVTAAGADFYERRMQAFVITGENTQLMVM